MGDTISQLLHRLQTVVRPLRAWKEVRIVLEYPPLTEDFGDLSDIPAVHVEGTDLRVQARTLEDSLCCLIKAARGLAPPPPWPHGCAPLAPPPEAAPPPAPEPAEEEDVDDESVAKALFFRWHRWKTGHRRYEVSWTDAPERQRAMFFALADTAADPTGAQDDE